MKPSQLERFAKPVIDLYTNLESELLINLAKSLKGKEELLSKDPESWRAQMLENLGMLDRENIKVIQKYASMSSEQLNKLLSEAGLRGVNEFEQDLKAALRKGAKLIEPVPLHQSPQILSILEAYQNQARSVFNLVNALLLENTKQTYRTKIDQAALNVLSGTHSSDAELRRLIRGWAEDGIPALYDRAGRRRTVEGYTRTVMRSTVNNVVNDMQDRRMEEWGIDLVEVSSHDGARPKCAPYQGLIYSLNPNHPKYPYIGDTSMGEPDGLFGINCGHTKYPYVEGISLKRFEPYPEEQNDRVYEESQEQRALERSIRKAKIRKNMFEAMGDSKGIEEAQALLYQRQAAMREFIKATGRTRRYGREQVYS